MRWIRAGTSIAGYSTVSDVVSSSVERWRTCSRVDARLWLGEQYFTSKQQQHNSFGSSGKSNYSSFSNNDDASKSKTMWLLFSFVNNTALEWYTSLIIKFIIPQICWRRGNDVSTWLCISVNHRSKEVIFEANKNRLVHAHLRLYRNKNLVVLFQARQ